jgi:metal-responsive CopG/Arc/MetJ family transcriptional regulator
MQILEVLILPIVAVSMSKSDLVALDELHNDAGFPSRSGVIRHALYALLAEHKSLEQAKGQVTVIMIVVYGERGKDDQCNRVQIKYSPLITATMHAHSTQGGCFEVVVANGEASKLHSFTKELRSQRQVTSVQTCLVEA